MVRSGDEVEWRSPEDALKLDVSLVEHVFRRLARQRRDESSVKRPRPVPSPALRERDDENQELPIATDKDAPPPPPPAQAQAPYFHPDMAFSKSDVLVTLEQAHGFMHKRPLLRMLHTSLACVSVEKEGASVEGFVRWRVKERTLSFATACDRLLQLHTRTQQAIAFASQVQAFTNEARARSPWCVRDWKSVHRSPSQFYKVHELPVKPKTQQQLDAERRVLQSVAAGVVNNALHVCVEKLVGDAVAARAKARAATSGRRSARSRTPGNEADAAARRTGTRSDPALRAKARRYREQAETEARRRELRLQIFIPAVETSALLSSLAVVAAAPASVSSGSSASPATAAGDARDSNDGDEDVLDEVRDSALNAPSDSENTAVRATKRAPSTARLLLLLATAEANGDPRIAERLAAQQIPRSGFQRALEQARNLGLARDDHWGLLKTWKSVYRAHSLQSLNAALAPHK